MKTVQYLEAVKAILNIDSDYALAKRLRVSKQRISSYRTGKSTFDNDMAVTVAEIVGTPYEKVIADMEIERGSTSELWRQTAAELTIDLSPEIWRRIRRVAAIAGVAAGGALLYRLQLAGVDVDQANMLAIAAVQVEPLRIMSTQAGTLVLAAIAVFAVFPELLRAPGGALAHWRDRILGIPALRLA